VATVIGGPNRPLVSPMMDIREEKKDEKNPMIVSITIGPSNPKGRSRGTTKRKIVEM
jgi:hypothetical protein